MQREPKAYLLDILEAIDLIEECVPPEMTLYRLESDRKTLAAMKHGFAIIGEAVYTLRTRLSFDVNFVPNYKKVEGLRHLIVHDYYKVEASVLIVIVWKHLSSLKEQIQKKLAELTSEQPPDPSSSPS